MAINLDLERTLAQARMLGRNRALAERASRFAGPAENPLSGEWVGDPTPSSLAEFLNLDTTDGSGVIEEACDNYEAAYQEAWVEGL